MHWKLRTLKLARKKKWEISLVENAPLVYDAWEHPFQSCHSPHLETQNYAQCIFFVDQTWIQSCGNNDHDAKATSLGSTSQVKYRSEISPLLWIQQTYGDSKSHWRYLRWGNCPVIKAKILALGVEILFTVATKPSMHSTRLPASFSILINTKSPSIVRKCLVQITH